MQLSVRLVLWLFTASLNALGAITSKVCGLAAIALGERWGVSLLWGRSAVRFCSRTPLIGRWRGALTMCAHVWRVSLLVSLRVRRAGS